MTSDSKFNDGMKTSNSIEWATPQAFYDLWNSRYHFNLDVCATAENAKCDCYYDIERDGLARNWSSPGKDLILPKMRNGMEYNIPEEGICFLNPPYGRTIGLWCKKALEESQYGALVVGLLPARTDTRWFHHYVLDHADLTFVQGRLKFVLPGGAAMSNSAPFPSMVAVWLPRNSGGAL